MPLTQHCDVFASASEAMVATIIGNVSRQRPSLFNYGTQSFVLDPGLMCQAIDVSPGLPPGQPLVSLQAPIPVPGTGGAFAVEYCAQLTKLELDLHPGNAITLPPELAPLREQSLALHAQVCASIACPSKDLLRRYSYAHADRYRMIDPIATLRGRDKGRAALPEGKPTVLPPGRGNNHCFCVDLFVTAQLERLSGPLGPTLGLTLDGLEIVDIKPDGLEGSLECLLSTTVSLGLLPRLRIALQDIVLSLGVYGNLTIGLTPTSGAVPFNPSIDKDRVSVLVDVVLS